MNLIEGIQKECNRVRKILPHYDAIGAAGSFGSLMLRQAIQEGEAAIASNDPVRMVKAFARLEGCTE